jgi:uncharacterized lipoprotein YddW (UPF0748 family)
LDWLKWQQKGLIDELVLQVYRNDLSSFTEEITQPEVLQVKEKIPLAIGIMTGLKGSITPLNLISEQIEQVKNRSFGGVSFFFYESLWNLASKETPQQRQQFWGSLFTK